MKEQWPENRTEEIKGKPLSKEVSRFQTRELQGELFSHQYQIQNRNSAPRTSQVKGDILKMPSGTRQIGERGTRGQSCSRVERRIDLKRRNPGRASCSVEMPWQPGTRCFLSNTVLFSNHRPLQPLPSQPSFLIIAIQLSWKGGI